MGMAKIGLWRLTASGGSEFVVVDLDPVAVRILQVDLLNAVGPHLWAFGGACPVAVFDMGLVEVFAEGFDVGNAEGEVDIDVVGDVLFGARDDMQFRVLGDLNPYVPAIVEGLGNLFEADHFFIEVGSALQVGHEDGGMVEMRALRAGRRRRCEGCGHNPYEGKCAGQGQSEHVLHGR
jgi:hypothetical protein